MMLDMFTITTPLSRKGNSYGNTVIESTNRLIKKEMICRLSHTAGGQGRQ
jgi:transposase InsO family protein